MPAPNKRFGTSGGVARPKSSADFQVLCLVSSVVEAPPAAKPPHRLDGRSTV